MTDFLDYEDDVQEDPDIAQAVKHISKPTDDVDIEMEEENSAPGFKPEFGHSCYDVNLVQPSDDTAPGAVSPVTAREDGMLDEETPQSKVPRMGRPGSDENPSHPIT